MRRDAHPVSQIKTVRIEALHARIEVQLRAPVRVSASDTPVKPCVPVAARALRRSGHQIVHVQYPAPGKELRDTEAGDGSHGAGLLDERQMIATLPLLPADALDELPLDNVRTQLRHCRETPADLVVRFGQSDGDHRRW